MTLGLRPPLLWHMKLLTRELKHIHSSALNDTEVRILHFWVLKFLHFAETCFFFNDLMLTDSFPNFSKLHSTLALCFLPSFLTKSNSQVYLCLFDIKTIQTLDLAC